MELIQHTVLFISPAITVQCSIRYAKIQIWNKNKKILLAQYKSILFLLFRFPKLKRSA